MAATSTMKPTAWLCRDPPAGPADRSPGPRGAGRRPHGAERRRGGRLCEPTDRYVIAPGARRAADARPAAVRRVPAIAGLAEALPLDDDAVDAATAMMTVRQWSDLDRGPRRAAAVARGTLSWCWPAKAITCPRYWLNDYAPDLIAGRAPPLSAHRPHRRAHRRRGRQVQPCRSIWTAPTASPRPSTAARTPAGPRGAQAHVVLGFMPPGAEARCVEALSADLESGRWDARHGHLRTRPTFESSMRLIVGWPA